VDEVDLVDGVDDARRGDERSRSVMPAQAGIQPSPAAQPWQSGVAGRAVLTASAAWRWARAAHDLYTRFIAALHAAATLSVDRRWRPERTMGGDRTMAQEFQGSTADGRGSGNGRRTPGKRNRLLANGLVALSSAAVVAVYATGYARTEPAAASVALLTPTTSVSAAPTATAALRTTLVTPTPAPSRPEAPAGSRSARTSPGSAAPAPTAPAPAAPLPATPGAATTAPLRDGSYVGTGRSRHGSIQATVVVQGGKIMSAQITQCGTRYPCSRIAQLPGQVVARQSAAVDVVTGATDSSVAYKQAVTAALAQAR
jgi:uncharacterized protein with FMN-binding domain